MFFKNFLTHFYNTIHITKKRQIRVSRDLLPLEMWFFQKFRQYLKKCKKVPSRPGFELATFGSYQNRAVILPTRPCGAKLFGIWR